MKKILNLQKVIDLRKTVESLITDAQVKIIANNPVLKGNKSEVDVKELYTRYNTLLDQLTILKLAQEKGNRKRTRFGGVTNQELILTRGNLQRKQILLEEMYNSKLHNRKGKTAPAFDFQFNKTDIEDELSTVYQQLDEISESMTKFNNSTTVKIVIFEELNLL